MVTIEDMREINNKVRTQGLVISRVPEKTRAEFVEFANGEFAGDYGLLLRELWECYKHHQQIINTQDIKLDYIIKMLQQPQINNQPKEGTKLPKFLGTKREVDE